MKLPGTLPVMLHSMIYCLPYNQTLIQLTFSRRELFFNISHIATGFTYLTVLFYTMVMGCFLTLILPQWVALRRVENSRRHCSKDYRKMQTHPPRETTVAIYWKELYNSTILTFDRQTDRSLFCQRLLRTIKVIHKK